MQKIYRDSVAYYVRSLPALLVVSALMEALARMQDHDLGSNLFLSLIAIHFFHRHFLFGEPFSFSKPAPNAPQMRYGKFGFVSLLIIFVPLAIALLVVLLPLTDLAQDRDTLVGLVLLVFLPLYLIVLSLFGTLLPAAVQGNKSFRVVHGMRAWFQVMWRLLLGPGVVGAAFFAGAVGWATLAFRYRLPEGPVAEFITNTVLGAIGFLPSILAVAVLCDVYKRIAPPLDPYRPE